MLVSALETLIVMPELREFLELFRELRTLVKGGKSFCRLFLAVGEDFSAEITASIAEGGHRLLLAGRALLRVLTALWMLVGCSCGKQLGGWFEESDSQLLKIELAEF